MTAVHVETEPAWGQGESLFQPRRAAFWLFAALLVFGVIKLISYFMPALDNTPDGMAIAIVLWGAWMIPFVWIVRRLDLMEPEPIPFLGAALAWGGIVATSLALIANGAFGSVIFKAAGTEFTQQWGAAIRAPIDEETLKALGVVVVILIAARQVNTLLDGLVYGAFVGLGFQVVENLAYSAREMQTAFANGSSPFEALWHIFVLRGFAAGLWSHAVYTGIVGVGIAYFVLRTDKTIQRRVAVAALLFAASCSLHFFWNSPLFDNVVKDDADLNIVALGLIKGLPALILVFVLYRLARRREVAWFDGALAGEETLVTPDELAALHTMKGRREAIQAEERQSGWRGARLRRQLQQAQVRLACAKVRAADPHDAMVEEARADVRSTRDALSKVSTSPVSGTRSPA